MFAVNLIKYVSIHDTRILVGCLTYRLAHWLMRWIDCCKDWLCGTFHCGFSDDSLLTCKQTEKFVSPCWCSILLQQGNRKDQSHRFESSSSGEQESKDCPRFGDSMVPQPACGLRFYGRFSPTPTTGMSQAQHSREGQHDDQVEKLQVRTRGLQRLKVLADWH